MSSKNKYLIAFVIPVATLFSILFHSYLSYLTLVISFFAIPILELILSPDTQNDEDEGATISMKFYDVLLYSMVPFQYVLLAFYLFTITTVSLETYELVGITLSMGVQCGAVGINVAHELGHRKSAFERFLAKSLLLSSLYMHFIVEHNRGHHKYVATPKDPATARLGESVYAFWIRSIIGSFVSAWNIEKRLQEKRGESTFNLKNEMIQIILTETFFSLAIYIGFGINGLIGFVAVSFIGIILLETVNYIEHYGLLRKMHENGEYERVQPWHSWNSDFPLGRIILFELTRHSDHHYKASKKYQILKHLDESPQLPTGYPGMMLLSLIPPLWYTIMNPRIEQISRLQRSGI